MTNTFYHFYRLRQRIIMSRGFSSTISLCLLRAVQLLTTIQSFSSTTKSRKTLPLFVLRKSNELLYHFFLKTIRKCRNKCIIMSRGFSLTISLLCSSNRPITDNERADSVLMGNTSDLESLGNIALIDLHHLTNTVVQYSSGEAGRTKQLNGHLTKEISCKVLCFCCTFFRMHNMLSNKTPLTLFLCKGI